MNFQSLPYVILTGFCFGSGLIALRFGLQQFNPFIYTGLRLFLASLAFLSIYLIARERYPWPTSGRLWLHSLVLAIIGTAAPTIGIILALQYLSSGLTGILITTSPALTVILAHFFLADESLTLKKSLGITLALSGAILLALRAESGLPDIAQANRTGYAILSVALIGISTSIIYTRKYLRDYASFDFTSLQMFIATLFILPISLVMIGLNLEPINLQGIFALGYSALIGTFTAFLLFYYVARTYGATTTAMIGYVNPVAATLGGILILNERVTGGMVLGMGLIITGIVIINHQQSR
ncbi:MAG: DMT family transporter [Chloroflexota bacterium]